MTSRSRYHYAYAFVFVAATMAVLLAGGLLGAGTIPQAAMHDIRIDVPAIMATTDFDHAAGRSHREPPLKHFCPKDCRSYPS